MLRYQCREGLAQRNLPLIRCQENGRWERPQISCVPRRPVSARGAATSPQEPLAPILVLPVTGCVTLKVSLPVSGRREVGQMRWGPSGADIRTFHQALGP